MTGVRVLIVDDDPDVAESLSDLLRLQGFETDMAGDGKAAVRAAHERAYDAVVIDVGLPDMDGIDTMFEIQRHQPGVRAVLMTGYRSLDIATRARETGTCEILVKPFDVSKLIRALSGPER